jgi:hypothetical protein
MNKELEKHLNDEEIEKEIDSLYQRIDELESKRNSRKSIEPFHIVCMCILGSMFIAVIIKYL